MAFAKILTETESYAHEGNWLLNSYLDAFSLVVYEIRQLACKGVLVDGADIYMTTANDVASSRHSTKLLNDTGKSIDQQLAMFQTRSVRNRDQMIDMTRAPRLLRSRLLGWLQEDSFVILVDGEVLATSQSLAFHADLEISSDAKRIFERGRELGSFLAAVSDADSEKFEETARSLSWRCPAVAVRDARYEQLYHAVFEGFALQESIALMIITCRIRLAKLLGRMANDGAHASDLALKFRLASIWQAAASLREIATQGTRFRIASSKLAELQELNASPRISALAQKSLRDLRNVLVHYRVSRAQAALLDWDDPLLGLPQALCGQSWLDVDVNLEHSASEMLELLDRWCGPVSGLLRVPV